MEGTFFQMDAYMGQGAKKPLKVPVKGVKIAVTITNDIIYHCLKTLKTKPC